jgi:hypothetical protein
MTQREFRPAIKISNLGQDVIAVSFPYNPGFVQTV